MNRIASFGAVMLALSLSAAAAAPAARGDDGSTEGPSLEQQIRAQMEKIVRLMKENEKAILEASLGAGKAPRPVDVKPPEAPPAVPPAGANGSEVEKRLTELIRGTGERGARIPKELEELVKMIPT